MTTATLDQPAVTAEQKVVLHVGCGAANPYKLPPDHFPTPQWRELRLDIDPGVEPDIIASITTMPMVANESVNAVWSAHNLEHLWSHEVALALAEFHRVLKPGGFALVTMPDLQQVAGLVAQGRLEEPAYVSALGPVSALDMLYGFRPSLKQGNHFMGHRTGFTAGTLAKHLGEAGFVDIVIERDGRFALWAKGSRP